MLIEDNFLGLGSHRVIFTKFPLFKNHLLLVTRDFISQYTHISFENIRDWVLWLRWVNGFGYFNGGWKAGASQPRKHLQVVPFSSLPEGGEIGWFQYIQSKGNLEEVEENCFFKVCKLKEFIVAGCCPEHVVFLFGQEIEGMMTDVKDKDKIGRVWMKIYWHGLHVLGLDKGGADVITEDYSFILTSKMMLLARRTESEVYISEEDEKNNLRINWNSLAFAFIITSRTERQIEEMKRGNIVKDVLSKW